MNCWILCSDSILAIQKVGTTPAPPDSEAADKIVATHVRKPLTLIASATRVRILDGQTELTEHHRTYDTGLTVG